jgi:glutaredoxin
VTIYGTSWCGACAAARRFFKANKVPFADHDIEREPEAEREMMTKAKRAGLAVSGVPVIDAGGQLMLGFDEGRLRRILGIR